MREKCIFKCFRNETGKCRKNKEDATKLQKEYLKTKSANVAFFPSAYNIKELSAYIVVFTNNKR